MPNGWFGLTSLTKISLRLGVSETHHYHTLIVISKSVLSGRASETEREKEREILSRGGKRDLIFLFFLLCPFPSPCPSFLFCWSLSHLFMRFPSRFFCTQLVVLVLEENLVPA